MADLVSFSPIAFSSDRQSLATWLPLKGILCDRARATQHLQHLMPDERRRPLGWLVNERVYVLAAERHRTSEGLTHGTTRGVAGPTVKYSAHACQQSGLQFWLPFEIVVPVGAASPPESRPTIVVPYKAHEPRRGRPMGQQSASPWKRRYQPWFIAAKPEPPGHGGGSIRAPVPLDRVPHQKPRHPQDTIRDRQHVRSSGHRLARLRLQHRRCQRASSIVVTIDPGRVTSSAPRRPRMAISIGEGDEPRQHRPGPAARHAVPFTGWKGEAW